MIHSTTTRAEHIKIAISTAIIAVVILTFTAPQIGLTWDEPTYLVAAEEYMEWLGELFVRPGYALSQEGIAHYWTFNNEHPPLSKFWSGLVWLGARHLFDDLTAHRLGNILLVGVLVALVYLMVAQEFGRGAGLAAVAALMTMPRFFFHAHLAALDVPVAMMTFAVMFVFWQTRNRPGLKWGILLGVVWGLALATKINAWFIPPLALGVWWLLFSRQRFLFGRLIVMGVVGALVCLAVWPWIYYDTLNRVLGFLGFLTLNRYPTVQTYFGTMYTPPPWHFSFVMVLAVVPFAITALYGIGALRALKEQQHRAYGAFLILGALISILILATPQSQIHDNERMAMPVFPFLAALAGVGFDWLLKSTQHFVRQVKKRQWTAAYTAIFVGILFLPQTAMSAAIYPYLLSYYSATVGGIWGAKLLHLETTYWCETYQAALPYLNQHAPPDSVIWAECHDVLVYYQRQDRLRSDLRVGTDSENAYSIFEGEEPYIGAMEDADFAVIQYRQSGHYRYVRAFMHAREPVHRLSRYRVTLLEIYER